MGAGHDSCIIRVKAEDFLQVLGIPCLFFCDLGIAQRIHIGFMRTGSNVLFLSNAGKASIEGDKKVAGRQAWRSFRELVKRKWADGLVNEVQRLTGSTQFTYVTAVTKLRGDAEVWQQYPLFKCAAHRHRFHFCLAEL